MRDYPYPMADGTRSIALGIIFSLLTCGIYSLYWQYKQMKTLNGWLGRTDYRFGLWLLLSFVTCGIYCPLLRIQDGSRNQRGSGEQRFASKQWLSSDLCFARVFWYWHRITCNPAMGNQQIL